ncbi:PREDICTED: tRNA-dihydrouridine(47) synthase [NAD(P)(+)]-like isoform X3 [Lupinus angustifolius]|uniref:tRNA-dihydrouridine(47) synthase [NAD(P)(+)]-like isoform X3 n=1 Tax=Lupinus angustifolius TaxID=3871 RepID=UPI00092FAC22|nr:PREDICTED: tRNA-dihydrouridine(47) synthase [NAD(P)(+)]-like isoform X3 [Lupinus angustifolius]
MDDTNSLVARCIAPVNKDFLRPPPPPLRNDNNNDGYHKNPINDKKSKRQQKRERREEQKSAKNLCPVVGKTGDVTCCIYKDKCRFSHDIDAFNAQKPPDVEGDCPFFKTQQGYCPYGLVCRFSSTHQPATTTTTPPLNNTSEVNGLTKNVQKLLWKNKITFPKADAKLKTLGLKVMSNSKRNDLENKDDGGNTAVNKSDPSYDNASHEVTSDSSSKLEEGIKDDGIDEKFEFDVCCPQKRRKTSENVGSAEPVTVITEAGVGVTEEIDDRSCIKAEPEAQTDTVTTETGVSKAEPEARTDTITAETGVHVTEESVERSCIKAETDTITPETDLSLKLHPREKKLIDFKDKLYLAPLTTVGNLPFRRVCKVLGADVTCGEMAMCTNLLQGQASEWALLRRHESEDLFGVQICGAFPDTVARAVELIEQECSIDFIDINMGCPIDIVVNKGAGSALLTKPMRMKSIVEVASGTVDKPITVKVRTAYFEGKNRIDSLIGDMNSWGASAVTIHGRSRQQRYSKLADWDYIYRCVKKAPNTLQVVGNGDVLSFVDWNNHRTEAPELATCMIARGALVKPWLFTEIKEQRHWDISSGERLNILKDFVHFGLQHWGSDTKGVETTRRFLLEWLSYTCRYVPVGLLDVVPQRMNWRPPSYYGRDDLETLMASDSAADWVRISEMLLGKVPEGFTFAPKHKSNAYDRAENG